MLLLAHGTNVLAASMAFHGVRAFSGFVTSGGFCGMPGQYTVYFAGQFDTPFTATGSWSGSTLQPGRAEASGADTGAWADFGTAHRTVKMRVAISFVDLAGARNNLRTEARSWDLNLVHARAVQAWRAALGHAAIEGGTDAQQHSFWTALYHSLLHPNVISDADGRYPGLTARFIPSLTVTANMEIGPDGTSIARSCNYLDFCFRMKRATWYVRCWMRMTRWAGFRVGRSLTTRPA